ncbi:MAG: hypothetical protein GXY13_07430 [Acidimicrobiales bacterium]|nr:hypothetical protein [Acidimicrobiales bacterium]
MAAPQYVPTDPVARVRAYRSNPRRPEPWWADRPGELEFQPYGDRLGDPGPDLGFAYKIARTFEPRLRLHDGEHRHDVVGGCVAVAMRRASIYGRAPVVHDLELAFTIWGYLDPTPDPALVEHRRTLFEGVGHVAHHYVELRDLVDSVPEDTLRLDPDDAARAYAADWRATLDA